MRVLSGKQKLTKESPLYEKLKKIVKNALSN